METNLTKTLIFIATVLAAVFAGVQTISSAGLFSLKRIQYDYINYSSSRDLTGGISDLVVSVKIDNDQTLIEDPHFIDILIKNNGNVDIPKDDIEGDIMFTFETAKPIYAQQISSSAPSLISSPVIHDNSIRVPPLLLNAGDDFVLRVLLDDEPKKITPHLRFLGMDSGFERIQDSKKFDRVDYVSIVMVVVAFAVAGRLFFLEMFYSLVPRWDILVSMFSVYLLGLLLAKQTDHLSGFSLPIELSILFSPAIITYLVSFYFLKGDES